MSPELAGDSTLASDDLQYTIIHRPCCLNVFMLYS